MDAAMELDGDPQIDLLDKVQAAIEVEKALTASLEKVEPWLSQQSASHPHHNPHRPRVRPLPTSLEEAQNVLAVARNLANRTSAPAGWNPAAPVIGFSTPNPLPHQLRGGALAVLQLERAQQAEADRKRQKRQQQDKKAKTNALAAATAAGTAKGADGSSTAAIPGDPKRADMREHEPPTERRPQQHPQQARAPKQQVSMNLSESSSSDDDEGDNDDAS